MDTASNQFTTRRAPPENWLGCKYITFACALLLSWPASAWAGALDEWTYRTNGVPLNKSIASVAYGAGRFVMVSLYPPMHLYSSEDGVAWTQRFTPPGNPYNAHVRFLHDRFVSVDDYGNCLTSTNGLNWVNSRGTNFSSDLRRAAYGNGRWVIVSYYSGRVWSSTNLVDWTEGTVTGDNAEQFWDLAFGNGYFLIASSSATGKVLLSTNGLDWTRHLGPSMGVVAAAQGKFVAVSGGNVLTASDGLAWGSHSLNFPQAFIMSLSYGNGTFIAVGSSNQSHHIILLSTDGTNWTPKLIGPRYPNSFLSDAAYGAGTFVVVADGYGPGSSPIAQSGNVAVPKLNNLQPQPAGSVTLDMDGEVGRAYRLEGSTNLLDWEELLTYTNDSPRTRVTAPPTNAVPTRFYRSVIP